MSLPCKLAVIRNKSWLRLACDHPLSESFFALLRELLDHAFKTMLDYNGGRVAKAESIAQLAANPLEPRFQPAREYISNARDHLTVIAILASYLMPEGNPQNNRPVDEFPHQIRLIPSWDVEPNFKPTVLPSALGPVAELTEEEKHVLCMSSSTKLILATANRCYADPQVRRGAVLGAMFFSMVIWIPEIKQEVQTQLAEEGLNESQRATILQYLTSELNFWTLADLTYANAKQFWAEAWLALTDTLRSNDFVRMNAAIQAHENAHVSEIEKVAKETEKKREARARSKLRKKQARSGRSISEAEACELGNVSEDEDAPVLADLAAAAANPTIPLSDKNSIALGVAAGALDDDDLDDILTQDLP